MGEPRLRQALQQNPVVTTILERARALGLPDWYLAAGAITGTVWNVLHGFAPTHGLKDYDIVYFDATDLSVGREAAAQRAAAALFGDLGVELDVKNEARVHCWYEQRFGRQIEPFGSTEHAISSFPTIASCVGVRDDTVSAPFGLDDLFAMVVRPNKVIVDQKIYVEKTNRWARLWPKLTVMPWEAG
jgi:hypothetical protein